VLNEFIFISVIATRPKAAKWTQWWIPMKADPLVARDEKPPEANAIAIRFTEITVAIQKEF
jgi:hypothetical protein